MDDDVLGSRRKLLILVRLEPPNKFYRIINKTSLRVRKVSCSKGFTDYAFSCPPACTRESG